MSSRYSFFKGNLILNALLLALLVLSSSCARRGVEQISSINIIDRNGMSETISEKTRLDAFQKTDFLAPQPYQKVLRVYARNSNGDVHAEITSYYPNGQVQQYLETVNNRAFGVYREWYLTGQKKIESRVIGGSADLNTQAQSSWLFDGENVAWDEEGHLAAKIPYNKGEIEGEALYYHPNGTLWKSAPHVKNQLHGLSKVYLNDGSLLSSTTYVNGLKEGKSERYWPSTSLAATEHYIAGLLKEGIYRDAKGVLICEIHNGNGFKALFGKEQLEELQEYKNGEREGQTKLFDENGALATLYHIKNGEKHGEETLYFSSQQPKLSMMWHEGVLQGPVKSWYKNGSLESQKEMNQNKKNGLFTAWYQNGSVMVLEEYENDKLLKGEYFRIGEIEPISKIEHGKGVATLFDPDGNFAKKIEYSQGRPLS